MARNIQVLRDYFLGKDPQLKETLADNSLRLIGIPGKHFVLRDELILRLKEQKDLLDAEDVNLQNQISALQFWKEHSDFVYDDELAEELANYYTKSQVDALLAVIPRFSIQVVQELPTQDISTTTIYLVPGNVNPLDETANYYDEYIYVNNQWELIGTTQIDMSDYYTKEEIDEKVFFKTLDEDWTIPENSAMNPLLESGWYYTGEHSVYYEGNLDPVIMNDTFFYYNGGNAEDQWFYLEPVNIQDMQNQIDVRLWFDVTENEWKYAGYGIIDDIAALKQNPNANLSAVVPTVNAAEAEYVIKSGDTMTGGLTTTNLTVGSRAIGSTVGANSVAEGYSTTASGDYSHAEGESTVASGISSHAEGSAQATAYGAHAEGDSNTIASGYYSHAEGSTSATRRYQHTEGKNNILDTGGTGNDREGDYIHIAGNGANINNRSNAHTLDWSGNAWFAGDVYVGSTSGTNKDAGSKKLATDDTFTGTDGVNAGVKGLVPAPATTDATKYLCADGTWGTPAGGGEMNTIDSISVNNVAQTPDVNKNVDITVPVITYGITDLTPGVSSLADGTFYFCYE